MDFDSLPIGLKPTNNMTFEDLIEEKLKIADQLDNEQIQLSKNRIKKPILKDQNQSDLEDSSNDQHNEDSNQDEQADSSGESESKKKPRAFLRRGEGLKRYQSNPKKKTVTQKKTSNTISSNSSRKSVSTNSSSGTKASTTTVNKSIKTTSNNNNIKASSTKTETKPINQKPKQEITKNLPTKTVNSKPIPAPIVNEINVKEIVDDIKQVDSDEETFSSNYFKKTTETKSKIEPEEEEVDNELKEFETLEKYVEEHPSFRSTTSYVESCFTTTEEALDLDTKQTQKSEYFNEIMEGFKNQQSTMFGLDSSSKIAELLKELNLNQKSKIENIYNNYRDLDENDFEHVENDKHSKHDYSDEFKEDDIENRTILESDSSKAQNTSGLSSSRSIVTRKIKRIYNKKNSDEEDDFAIENEKESGNDFDKYLIESRSSLSKNSDYKSSNYKDDDFDEYEDTNLEDHYDMQYDNKVKSSLINRAELSNEKDSNKIKKVKFDDTSSWLDQSGNKSPKDEWNDERGIENENSKEPVVVSKLINKLFPSIKEQELKQKQELVQQQQLKDKEIFDRIKQAQINENQATISNRNLSSSSASNLNASVLKEKINQLESEIEKFQKKNFDLTKLKEKLDVELKLAETNRKLIDKQKQDEFNRLKELHDEEMRKLKQERKIFDQYKQSIKDKPDRKERDEIDRLNRQINDLNEELKSRETRWIANNNRLKERIETLEKEKLELKKELQFVEKQRIDSLIKMTSSSSLTMAQNSENQRCKNQQLTINTHNISSESEYAQNYLKRTTSEKSLPNSSPSSSSSSIGSTGSLALHSNLNPQSHNSNFTNQLFKNTSTTSPLESNSLDSLKSDYRVLNHKSLSPSSNQQNVKSVKFNLDQLKEIRNYSPMMMRNDEYENESSYKPNTPSSNVKPNRDEYVVSSLSGIDRKLKVKETRVVEGKHVDKLLEDETMLTVFPNGTTKEVSGDRKKILVKFFNGDRKEMNHETGTETYFYAETNITQISYSNGLKVLKFPNGQIEKHHVDRTREIIFPDKICKFIYPDGSEETRLPNGTCIKIDKIGDKVIEYPNKQREIHTKEFKRREYPDGSIKTVYTNGLSETRYANGRIRLKDSLGNIISDTKP